MIKTNCHLILKSFPPEDGCAGAPTLSYGPPPLRIPILQKDEDDHDDDDDGDDGDDDDDDDEDDDDDDDDDDDNIMFGDHWLTISKSREQN